MEEDGLYEITSLQKSITTRNIFSSSAEINFSSDAAWLFLWKLFPEVYISSLVLLNIREWKSTRRNFVQEFIARDGKEVLEEQPHQGVLG